MTSAESNLEKDPPPMVLTSLYEVFDQHHSQAGKVRNPSPLRYLWYSSFAVAASMALFFIIYSGFNDREVQKRLPVASQKSKKGNANKQSETPTIQAKNPEKQPLLAENKKTINQNEQVVFDETISITEPTVASNEMEDAKVSFESGIDVNLGQVPEAENSRDDYVSQNKSASYAWSSPKSKDSDNLQEVSIASKSLNAKGNQNYRSNNKVLLKRIKPVY